MRLLWVCNVLPQMVADQLNMPGSNKEGWITGALERLMVSPEGMELAIAFPVDAPNKELSYSVTLGNLSITAYGYYEDQTKPQDYSLSMEPRFMQVIDEYKPEIIHVFGTEFGHTLAVARVVNDMENAPKLLVGLQGIISRCGEEYTAELPDIVVNSLTFRDLIKNDNIARQQAKFLERGEMETEALKLVKNVTGRTQFDREFIESINPEANYYHMNETLRSPFYTGIWDVTDCDKHTIFVSQADYPLKGFHILLEAMPVILERFPDAKIVAAGANIVAYNSLKDKIKISGYGKYLLSLIRTYHLEDKVQFTGRISADKMKECYLRCNVYACPSSLENSPNSMGEAMLLGVPVVASRTGGIPSMITEEEEGLLFEVANSEGLAADIIRIFSDDAYATELGAKGMNRARATHDADVNYNRLLEIYRSI